MLVKKSSDSGSQQLSEIIGFVLPFLFVTNNTHCMSCSREIHVGLHHGWGNKKVAFDTEQSLDKINVNLHL